MKKQHKEKGIGAGRPELSMFDPWAEHITQRLNQRMFLKDIFEEIIDKVVEVNKLKKRPSFSTLSKFIKRKKL